MPDRVSVNAPSRMPSRPKPIMPLPLTPPVPVFGSFTPAGACAVYGFAPKWTSVWAPLYVAIEIPFMVGLVLLVSSVIVQMRDLQQIIPIVMPLLMLLTVLKPLNQEAHHHLYPNLSYVLGHGVLRDIFCVVNPMAPIIDNMRASVLLGFGPQWHTLVLGMIGSVIYLVFGFVVFKRLEVNFADLT